ncbi:MAG: 16S rRNA (guanine(527)-N(7))-methyltransferase RsmG [Actinomycetota bacterium]|nr:16S rRNA (guanine(527)-N(7))-methyltransferase RsmG [Actinomycetota bacterium]
MPEDQLAAYVELLRSRAIDMGLVSTSDRGRLMERHVEDSLRAVPLLGDRRQVVDIGSGGGLPGVPLAIARPDLSFVLVEPKERAVAFLELAVESLGVPNVKIRHARIEDVELQADAATARAFAPLPRTWAAASRALKPGGRLIYFAGASFDPAEARDITDPEPPASVELAGSGVESPAPLVIMTREE